MNYGSERFYNDRRYQGELECSIDLLKTSTIDSDMSYPHVWLLNLQNPKVVTADYEWWRIRGGLTDGEIENAARISNENVRRTYLGARLLTRQVLAEYLERPPGNLVFKIGSYGKPSLIDNRGMEFNLSHSAEIVACVIAPEQIGLDIEFLNRRIDYNKILKGNFSDREIEFVLSGGDRSKERFFQIWTLKEACFKRLGMGLSVSLMSAEFYHEYARKDVMEPVHFGVDAEGLSCQIVGRPSSDIIAMIDGEFAGWCSTVQPFGGYVMSICSLTKLPLPAYYWFLP